MPNIRVELLPGRTVDQRRAFAEAVTLAAVEALGAQREHVRIMFEEVAADLVANGGVLASEDDDRAAAVARAASHSA
ncbi:tautomerase family protein [Microbacterium sp. AK031]|uniref:tautomerase family protein n=1 Tax=Microbacterium sp. AK031 TaxID=2723076 RepID=UPI0021673EBC|nr:tautomerase family protein [Microbacterium sp. AK031]MCS3844898.1 4-oxalocrotonate tautomerase [Microbacterium sp. AK031]